jgi:hypothetical protein
MAGPGEETIEQSKELIREIEELLARAALKQRTLTRRPTSGSTASPPDNSAGATTADTEDCVGQEPGCAGGAAGGGRGFGTMTDTRYSHPTRRRSP